MRTFKLTFLLTVLTSMVGVSALAYDAKVNGIYYTFSGSKATVTYCEEDEDGGIYSGYSGSIVIPSSITYNGKSYAVETIGSCAFLGSSITAISIPSSMKSIEESAFAQCDKLTAIDINASNLSIAKGMFVSCSNLKTVNLSSITDWLTCHLGNTASSPFCHGANLYVADEEMTALTFPTSVTSIPAYAFYGCSNVTTVTISAFVSNIGTEAFGSNASLTAINVRPGNSNYSSEDDVLYNVDKTTLITCPCGKSGSFQVPTTVTCIKEYAFRGCTNLSSIVIPENVAAIGTYAFQYCAGELHVNCNIPNGSYTRLSMSSFSYNSPFMGSKFNEVVIGEGVTSIGDYAFYDCSSIEKITLPNSLKEIGLMAFKDCTGLTAVALPKELAAISDNAFSGCDHLTSVSVEREEPVEISTYTFSNAANATLYVPAGTKEAYKAAEGWKDFKEIVERSNGKALRGDVNGDGKVDIADVTALVNIILGKS